jgi:uncharacterized protein (TIGR03086 family)
MIAGAERFALVARGEYEGRPNDPMPDVIGSDPTTSYPEARAKVLAAFGAPGVLKRILTAPFGEILGSELLAVGCNDQLVHGWDLAQATAQDARIPSDLAAETLTAIDGRLERFRASGRFAKAVPLGAGSTPEDKLLAYNGRNP